MRLIHYTDKEFELKPMKYDQEKLRWQAKPNGLWFSVEGEYDWKWWCEGENYNLENLVISYEVKLRKDAKILHLKSALQVLNLSRKYPFIKKQWDTPKGRQICATYEVDWEKIKAKYQGIIISPYQWDCRLHNGCNWYYGWDCASGCIWDLDCIEEFKLRQDNE